MIIHIFRFEKVVPVKTFFEDLTYIFIRLTKQIFKNYYKICIFYLKLK